MPYPKHKPVDEEEMLKPATEEEMAFSRYSGHHTICQTLREIWAKSWDEETKLKCRLAVSMAKAMVTKLKTYRDMVGPEEARRIEKEIDNEICYGKPAQAPKAEQVKQAEQAEQAKKLEQFEQSGQGVRPKSVRVGRFHR